MKPKFSLLKLVVLATLLAVTSAHAADPLRVFIRGGQKSHGPGAHEHERFAREWAQLLQDRGMEADSSLKFPTADQLADKDVLVMYAQEAGNITPEQRPVLESFLKKGGGLVIIHTASVADSPETTPYWKSIIGGSWVRGETKWLEGPMSLYYVDRTHPITQGVANFDLDDEIYYDMDLHPDINVLAASYTPKTSSARRNDQRGQPGPGKVTVYDIQPQIWTFENAIDDGAPYRAFVTIPGHLYSTFSLPQYRALLLRGISWAGKRDRLDQFTTEEELASLRYPVGGPKRPEDSLAQTEIHPDFTMSLVATEPLINKPMNIDWDAQGRLWVAETPEYPDGRYANSPSDLVQRWVDGKLNPNTGRYERPAYDKVSILLDTDNDGVMDKKQIFFEGLELVTSLVFHKDGVIVSQAPDILWLRDTDNDDRADKVETLYTGLGTGDTHAVLNNLRWGFDGWIYGTHGYSAGEVTSPDGATKFGRIGSGVVRFKPDGSAMEQFSSKGGNTWGLQLSWDNEVFWTQPTSGDLLMHVIMSENELSQSGVDRLPSFHVVSKSIPVFPLIPYDQLPYVQIDQVGRFTAAAGTVIYNGGAWPDKWNYDYFTTEPTVNIVHHQSVERDGISYTASRAPDRAETEFIAGRDMWFRPIEVRVGPDGAVYMVDFYNQAVIHNDTRGPKHGPRNAAVRPDRDHYYGRIWRIDHKDSKKLRVPNLADAEPRRLVQSLGHPNLHVRMNAMQQIIEHFSPPEAQASARMARALSRVAANADTPEAKVAALWALHRIQSGGEPALISRTLQAASQDPDAAVRKNALRVAGQLAPSDSLLRSALARVEDSDPQVRLEALGALGNYDLSGNAPIVEQLTRAYPSFENRYLQAAFMRIANQAPAGFLTAALQHLDGSQNSELIQNLTQRIVDQGDSSQAANLVVTLADLPASMDPAKETMLRALAARADGAPPAWNDSLEGALRTLLNSENDSLSTAILPLAVQWNRNNSLDAAINQQIEGLIRQLRATNTSDERQRNIIQSLLSLREQTEQVWPAVTEALLQADSATLQQAILDSIADLSDPKAGQVMVNALPSLRPEAQNAAFNHLLKRPEWSLELVQALDSGDIPFQLLGPANAHRLRLHPDARVAERASQVIEKIRGPVIQEKNELIAELIPAVQQEGNLDNGREIYQANCATCHQLEGSGNPVGPPLDGMGAHPPAELLSQILDPNREVELSFVAWSIETKDGEIYDGVISRENASMVALRNAAGEQQISKDNIASRRNTGRSLMPEGFEALGAEGIRDLIAYMRGGEDRFRFVDLTPTFTADSRQGMYRSLESSNERLHLRKRGVVEAHGIPFLISSPTKHPKGHDVMVLKGGPGNVFSQSLPQEVEAKLGFPAKALHVLGGVAGWGFPAVREEVPVLRVTVHYADGTTEQHVGRNALEFADYIGPVDVPNSKQVKDLTDGNQLRLYTIPLKGKGTIDKVVFQSFGNNVAPTTVAVTADRQPAASPNTSSAVTPSTHGQAGLDWGNRPRALLIGGGSSHDFQRWFNQEDKEILKSAGFSVHYTEDPAVAARELQHVDVAVLSVNATGFDTPGVRNALSKFVSEGKGLVLLHPGLWYNYQDWPEYNRVLAGGGSRGHDKLGSFKVAVTKDHPITRGVPAEFEIVDELYHFIPDDSGTPLTTLVETSVSSVTKKRHPSVFIVRHPQTRIVGITLGHDGRAHQHEAFRTLLVNATRWAAEK